MAHILSNQWLTRRRPYWERLEKLLAQADSTGLGQLSRTELRELALLYRQVAADLSSLRQDETARTYAVHVNQLLARAHHVIYSGRKASLVTVFRFLRNEYPPIFRRNVGYVAASLLLMVCCGFLGAVLTLTRPEFMSHAIPPQMIATMERHEMWTHSIVSVAPMETSRIMTNNLSVSFITFAGGITFGLFTLFSLYNNGMMLGVIGAACHHYGMSLGLWSFVVAHGSLELPSIVIAGAAGLRLGAAMVFPGGYRWKESVSRGGIEATRLVSGIIPLLVIAGCLEGFFSPSAAPIWMKFVTGAVLFAALIVWLFRPTKKQVSVGQENL